MRIEASQNILDFVERLNKRQLPKTRAKILSYNKSDLYVPLDRTTDLKSLFEWKEEGKLHGPITILNDKARKKEFRAIKVPGKRGWQMLPEWVEEYNNGGLKLKRNGR
jgi:hypothetical protein